MTGKDGEALPEITAKHIIIATGARATHASRPRTRRQADLDLQGGDGAGDASRARCSIVGSGAIGIEFASFYRTLGAHVTVVEMLDRILPAEDEEISRLAQKAFAKQGIAIRTGTTVERLVTNDDSVTATLRAPDGDTIDGTVDRVILAVGITGNVEGLGLEEQGVKVDKGHIVVDEWCRTGVARPLCHRRRGGPALARPQGDA